MSPSPRTRSGPRRSARVVAGTLERQANRTKYLPYFDEHTQRYDAFIDKLQRAVPRAGATRDALRKMVHELSKGRLRVYYNSIVETRPAEDAARRLRF